ncbi:MAG: hypothetical protein KKI09_03220 [Spirochaetes bacterium]|nr:hypothetical protein [Spirochaetota bacterium]MBU0954417.1 hypothetical protein [Spirochaetota bacterium]
MKTQISVAGNLLLAGEYLVLEEGGPGLALALEPRITLEAQAAAEWSLEARMGPQRQLWTPGERGLPLADAIFDTAAEYLAAAGRSFPHPAKIIIDTSPFFDQDGRKSGYGSSAAAAVALSLYLLRSARPNQSGEEAVAVAPAAAASAVTEGSASTSLSAAMPAELAVALHGHRRMQGGRGSGYDIFTSYYGGFGLFSGGVEPAWQKLAAQQLPDLFLYQGLSPVSSAAAVAAFTAARYGSEQSLVEACLQSSRAAVLDYACGRSALAECLYAARAAGLKLGRLIAVDARMSPDFDQPELFSKALGAGNELGCLVSVRGDRPWEAALAGMNLLPVRLSGPPLCTGASV